MKIKVLKMLRIIRIIINDIKIKERTILMLIFVVANKIRILI